MEPLASHRLGALQTRSALPSPRALVVQLRSASQAAFQRRSFSADHSAATFACMGRHDGFLRVCRVCTRRPRDRVAPSPLFAVGRGAGFRVPAQMMTYICHTPV